MSAGPLAAAPPYPRLREANGLDIAGGCSCCGSCCCRCMATGTATGVLPAAGCCEPPSDGAWNVLLVWTGMGSNLNELLPTAAVAAPPTGPCVVSNSEKSTPILPDRLCRRQERRATNNTDNGCLVVCTQQQAACILANIATSTRKAGQAKSTPILPNWPLHQHTCAGCTGRTGAASGCLRARTSAAPGGRQKRSTAMLGLGGNTHSRRAHKLDACLGFPATAAAHRPIGSAGSSQRPATSFLNEAFWCC